MATHGTIVGGWVQYNPMAVGAEHGQRARDWIWRRGGNTHYRCIQITDPFI